MKIALLGDTHFSIFGSSPAKSKIFQKNIKQFFDNIFFPYIKNHNIKTVFQSGDLFDSRRANQSDAIKNAKECFFDPLQKQGISLYTIIGNHDIFYRESLKVNSQDLYLGGYDNIDIIDSPKSIEFDGIDIDFIPWICEENRSEATNFIKKSNSNIAFGHFEINGFEMSTNNYCETGIDRNIFSNYSKVWSGHFHKKSQYGNIMYLGSPSQHTWDDCDDIRGFYVYDTEKEDMEFIENTYNMFVRIYYENQDEICIDSVEDKFVRVICEEIEDENKFEKFISKISEQNPFELRTIKIQKKSTEDVGELSVEDLESESFSMIDYLTEYAYSNKTTDNVDKDRIKNYIEELYTSAIRDE